MLFTEARQKIMDCLVQAGCREKIETSKKRLKLNKSYRVGAVLFEKEQLEKDKWKRIFYSDDGKKKRRKLYKRELTFNVIIADADIDAVESIYEKFLEQLPDGIYVDGNWTELIPEEADWLDDEDTILSAKCAVQFLVRCTGGIYKDTDFRRIENVQVEVEKEEQHGEADNDSADGNV